MIFLHCNHDKKIDNFKCQLFQFINNIHHTMSTDMAELPKHGEYTMYILVNVDLNMSKGKIAAQVGHVTEMIGEHMTSLTYESAKVTDILLGYMTYKTSGRKKVVLGGTQKQLEDLSKDADAFVVIDAGRTEVPKDSMTVVGFLPSNTNKSRFEHFRLLKP
jgi:PTH2 family peptidyl-tRNA hydrolase